MQYNNNEKPKAEVNPAEAKKPKYVLSPNPDRAMQEMMTTIDHLRLSLIEETKALKEADTQTFMDLQE